MPLLLAFISTACGSVGTDEQSAEKEEGAPYKIGLLAPLTGEAGSHGPIMIDGAKMAVEEVNSAGGILGHKVELIPLDSAADPETGVSATRKLIQEEKVDAIIGTYRTGVALAVMDVIADAKLPFIISMAASDEIRKTIAGDYDYYKYTFKVAPDVADYTDNLMPFLTDIVKAKTYYFIGENDAWAQSLNKVMKGQTEAAGIERVGQALIDPGTTEFTPAILDIKKKNPDVVVCGIITAPGVPFAKQYYDAKAPAPMVVTSGVLTMPETVKDMGAQADYISFGMFNIDKPITELTVPFWKKFFSKYGYRGTGFNETKSYDSIKVLADAINETGSFDNEALVTTLEQGSFMGVCGNYQFDPKDHQAKWGPGYVTGVLAEWKDGTAQVIWPAEMADSELIRAPWWK